MACYVEVGHPAKRCVVSDDLRLATVEAEDLVNNARERLPLVPLRFP